MRVTIEINRPAWMTPARVRRAPALLLVLALVLAGPALASDRFDDVDDTNDHHANITAIAEAGITLGCNAEGTLYCPDTVVTRDQMASFIARTAGLGANPPVADADLLDGLDASDLGITQYAFASGDAASPSADIQFLAAPATVTVATGQVVHVTSNRAFGSTVGAASLDLAICFRPDGSIETPTPFGPGTFDQAVPAGTRVVMGLSAVIALNSGTYDVGLCGDSDFDTNWNSNEWSYTTAFVGPAPLGTVGASGLSIEIAPSDGRGE